MGVTASTFRSMALAFDQTEASPHFEKESFRIRKKIFATMDTSSKRVVLKLTEMDQSVFCTFDSSIVYPVPGAWGKKGWTIVELSKIRKDTLHDALTMAYCTVAPKSLADNYR